jgi:nitrite reductase/ring-hydroxylating ferredoxin subunit
MAEAVVVCGSGELVDRGKAVLFDVVQHGQQLRAFVLRHDGRVVAYLNRCQHVPVEMDWLPGEFLDAERENIICSIHGATYRPDDGRCIGGPCGRSRLTALNVEEHAEQVCWYPSDTIRPVPAAATESPT